MRTLFIILVLLCLLFAACKTEQPQPKANEAPLASFTLTPESGSAPLEVTVDAASSTDDGSLQTFSWNWGDDSVPDTGVSAKHTFSSPGSFTLTLTVTDDQGVTAQTTKTVTISEPNDGGNDDGGNDGGDDGGDDNPNEDKTAPTLLSVQFVSTDHGTQNVTPGTLTKGVDRRANIVLTFSEPMNQEATQAAFESDDPELAALGVTFTWFSSSTILTIDPKVSLEYSEGSAKRYSFNLLQTATDVAGNSLDTKKIINFSTLRKVTETMPALLGLEAITVKTRNNDVFNFSLLAGDEGLTIGDLESGLFLDIQRSFLAFDISNLSTTLRREDILSTELSLFQKEKSSTLDGTPYNDLGSLLLEHVATGDSLVGTDYDTNPLSLITSFADKDNQEATLATNNSQLLNAVRDARDTAGSKRVQFRLRFFLEFNDDNRFDRLTLVSSQDPNVSQRPKLELTYLVP